MWWWDNAYKAHPEINKWELGVLHVVNICFVIIGIILTCRAGDLTTNTDGIQFFVMQNYYVFGTIMTIVGSFNIVMGLIGIYCTVRNHFAVIFSYSYFIVLTLIALLLLAAVILGEDLNSFAKQEISEVMNISMHKYNLEHVDVAIAWDTLQRQFLCCGCEGPLDWMSIINNLPITCCQIPLGFDGPFLCTIHESNKNLYRTGCMSRLLEFIRTGVSNLAAIGISFFVCQIVFLLVLFIFGRSFRESKKRDSSTIIDHNNLSKPQDPIQWIKISEDDKSKSVYF